MLFSKPLPVTLDAQDMRRLALYLHQEARSHDMRAEHLEQMSREIVPVEKYYDHGLALADDVLTLINRGHDEDKAIAMVAAKTGMREDSVQHWWRKRHRELRTRDIVRLVAKGIPNLKIARRFKLHPNTVRAIIRKAHQFQPTLDWAKEDQSFEITKAKDFAIWLWLACCVSVKLKQAGHTGHAKRLKSAVFTAVPLYAEDMGRDALSAAIDEIKAFMDQDEAAAGTPDGAPPGGPPA